MRKWIFLLAMSIGLALRILLAPISGHPFDMTVYFETGQDIVTGRNFYGTTDYAYPPAWAAFIGVGTLWYAPLSRLVGAYPLPTWKVEQILGVPVPVRFVADWLFHAIMKAPLVAFDLFLALLLRRVVAQTLNRPDRADMAAVLFFLNPHVLWISGIWGTFDVLPTYFAILGTLLFLDRRPYLSGLTFGFAVALKYFPVLLLFALLLGYRKRLNAAFVGRLGFAMTAFLAVVSVPFLVLDSGAYVRGILSPTGGVYVGNLSVWVLASLAGVGNLPSWAAALNVVLIAMAIGVFCWVAGSRDERAKEPAHWIDLCLLALFVFYAVFRIVNDQYILWSIPFLTLGAALGRMRWPSVLGFSALATLSGVVNVTHYSFFLPILTISPDLVWLIPRFPYEPVLRSVLALVIWGWIIVMLRRTIRFATGEGEVTQFLKSLWTRMTLGMRRESSEP